MSVGWMAFAFNVTSNVEVDHIYCYNVGLGSNVWANINRPSAMTWDSIRFHDLVLYLPKSNGTAAPYSWGCDGVDSGGDGVSLYNSTIIAYAAAYSGGQHQDATQMLGGSYMKFYNNLFENFGNSAVYLDGCGWNFEHVRIFNNIALSNDGGTVGQFMVAGENPINGASSFGYTDVLMANNLVDNGGAYGFAYSMKSTASVPVTFTNCRMANNIAMRGTYVLYNNPTTPEVADLTLTDSAAAADFLSYMIGSSTNNYRLTPAATALIGQGMNLSSYCADSPELCRDRDGHARPATGAWDVGPYQHQ
jgi:hypothetical protein